MATTDFKGQVEIQEGELRLTDANAAGVDTKIEVTGDAATLHLNFPRPAGANIDTEFFTGHGVTIRGNGLGGKGAFRYTAIDWGFDDSMLESLTLSGDAYIAVPSRFGIKRELNLNGHTLTRIDGGDNWQFRSSQLQIDTGTIKNATGNFVIQNTPVLTDPDNTTISMNGGTLYVYNMRPALTCKVIFCGGKLSVDAGTSPESNIFAGTIIMEKDLAPRVDNKDKVLQFTGNFIRNNGALFPLGPGTLYFNCTTGNPNWIFLESLAEVAFTSNITRKINDMRSVAIPHASYRIDAGRLEVGIVRMPNGGAGQSGTIFQNGGEIRSTGDIFLGNGAETYGAFVMTGGTNVFDKYIKIADSTKKALGAFWQYGGKNSCSDYIDLAVAGRGFLGVWNGGEFECCTDKYDNGERIRLGIEHCGASVLSIDGAGSVLETGVLTIGAHTAISTNHIVVSNGGALKARRLYRFPTAGEDSYSEIYVNGGIIMPTFWDEWNKPGWTAGGRRCSPNHWVIGPKGMIIDTSALLGKDATQEVNDSNKISKWFHVLEDPEGQGIASIELPTDNSEFMKEIYNAPAFIDIEGPEGSRGAIAMAEIDPLTKELKGAVVIAEGSNYDSATRVYVHSATNKYYRFECKYTLTGERASGPLIKRGDGTVAFNFDNTYTGGTIVEEGKIELAAGKGFPGNTPLDVREGAIFDSTGYGLTVSYLGSGGGTILSSGLKVTKGIRISPKVFFEENSSLQVSSYVNFAEGCELVIDDIESLHEYRSCKAKAVFTAKNGIEGTIPKKDMVDSQGTRWVLYKTGNSVKFGPVNSLRIIVK